MRHPNNFLGRPGRSGSADWTFIYTLQLKNIKDRAILPRLDDEPRSLESRSTASATDQLMNDEMRYQRMFVDLTSDGTRDWALRVGRKILVYLFSVLCFDSIQLREWRVEAYGGRNFEVLHWHIVMRLQRLSVKFFNDCWCLPGSLTEHYHSRILKSLV